MTVVDPAEAALLALAHLDEGDGAAALAALIALSATHAGHADVADAWVALGDSGAARGAFGVDVLQALVPIAREWPDARGRATLMMALAELEVTHREASWAAHWLKAAMRAEPADPRPWDLLELMLDAHPGLPVGRDTLKMLEQLRKARGELPINEDDFAGETFDEWEEGAG